MSFQYGQFGAGFERASPSREARQFRDLVEARGTDISIVALASIGEDDYGNLIHSESSYIERAFVEERSRELSTAAGAVKSGSMRFFVVPWAAVGEEGYEVEFEGRRFRITGLVKTSACLQIEAERKMR
jgi:hypothetical protein